MTKEQTNSWEENWEDFVDNSGKVNYLLEGEDEAIKQFISKTISQEKEKWEEELLANIKNMREVAIISDGTPLREGLVSKETLLNLLQK